MSDIFDIKWMYNIIDDPRICISPLHQYRDNCSSEVRILICNSGDCELHSHTPIPPQIKKMYTTNCCVPPDDRFYGIPYGVMETQKQILLNHKFNLDKTQLVYCNFRTGSNRSRPIIYNKMAHLPFVICESPPQKIDNVVRTHYLQQLASSKFTISPPGNGRDTYRMWEALMLGSIPIVIQHPMIDHFKDDLPILAVPHYDFTEEFLLEEYERISNTHYPKNYLSIQYWIDRWKADLNE